MRTDKERIELMHKRAKELEWESHSRRLRVTGALVTAACFVLVIAFAVMMPEISGTIAPAGDSGNMNASVFSGGSALGYIVIAILAFILGAAVTIFCYRLKKRQMEMYGEHDDDLD